MKNFTPGELVTFPTGVVIYRITKVTPMDGWDSLTLMSLHSGRGRVLHESKVNRFFS